MTPEEKAKQIETTIVKEEGEPLSEREELQVIAGKGVEFLLLNGDKLYIPPLTVRQYEYLLDLEEIDKLTDPRAVLTRRTEVVAKILGKDLDEMKNVLCKDDIEEILQLALYSGLAGKSIFKKKVLTMEEVRGVISALRATIPK